MRNARSRSTFKPRLRQRTAGKAGGVKQSIVKSVLDSAKDSTYDPELVSWLKRVTAVGGSVNSSQIDAVNTFLRSIKKVDGLRDKIKRLNVFCGSSLDAALVPLIFEGSSTQDINNNFSDSEYSKSSGLKNSTALGNKYLDTNVNFSDLGLSFTDGHLAIHTSGTNTSSSYKEWIGRDHAALGSNKQNNKFQFRWGEHVVYANNPNPQDGTCMGFYLGNASSSEIKLWLNDKAVTTQNISSNSPSNVDLTQNFHIFKRNTVYTAPNDFDQTVNFYSIGLSLDDEQTKALYDAVAVLNHALERGTYQTKDVEVWKWANHRIAESVGDIDSHFSYSAVQNADAWMTKIKLAGIRNKISRANLFLGKSGGNYSYLSALVPLIIDSGNRTDVNNNFINSDYNVSTGFRGDGATKYLDTGVKSSSLLSDLSAHISVETTTAAENIYAAETSNCLIGSKEEIASGGHGFSLNLSKDKFYSKFVEESMRNDASSSVGMFTLSVNNSSSARQFYAGSFLADISNSKTIESWVTKGDRSLTLFACNAEDYSRIGFSKQSIKSYSIGSSLSDLEVSTLSEANLGINRKELVSSDSDIRKWANYTVPSLGGSLTQKEVDAATAWMTKIKSVSGLKDKIKRANLMMGSDLNTKLIPIISTLGNKVDTQTSITDENVNVKGVLGGKDRQIETGLKLDELITDSAGHFSVQHARNFLPTNNAHGVITSDANKPNFGFKFTNTGVESYVFNSANPASYALSGVSVDSYSIARNVPSAPVFQFNKYYLHPPNSSSFFIPEIIKDYTVLKTGLLNLSTTLTMSPSIGAKTYTYVNGLLVDVSNFAKRGSHSTGAFVDLDISVNVRKGDKISVSVNFQNSYERNLSTMHASSQVNFTTDENFSATISAPVEESVDGLLTVSRESNTSLKLYRNKVLKNTSTTAPSGSIVNRSDFTYILGSYSDDGSLSNDFRGTATELGFYSMGDGLTQAQVEGLSDAYTAFETTLERDLDEEVWDWVFNKIPKNGGRIDPAKISHINTFMTALKAESGLRESIRRLNIFAGSITNSAMVPLIQDFGESIDTNINFTSTDVNQGLLGGNGKYLDTKLNSENINNFSASNFHIGVFPEGTLPSSSNGYALSNDDIKLNLSSSSIKFEYGGSSITSSHNEEGFLIATSEDNTGVKLYRGATNSDSGSYDGTFGTSSANFVVLGNSTESGKTSGFNGRISAYSIGTQLSSSQVSAFNSALNALRVSLGTGGYFAEDPDAWRWANVNVPLNSGTVTQEQVTAVDKFMKSVNSIPNLRKSIKRMNLFVGQDLNAALVPVVSDLGSTSDTNNNFVSGDYISTGSCAGLKTDGSKTLDTTVKGNQVLGENWNFSFRSPDGISDSTRMLPIAGCEEGFSARRFGTNLGKVALTLASSKGQLVTTNKYSNYVSDFRDTPSEYKGCLLQGDSIMGSTDYDLSTSESSCESSQGGQIGYERLNSNKSKNDRLNCEFSINESVSVDRQTFGDAAVMFDLNHFDGSTKDLDKCKGFYSFLCSTRNQVSNIEIYRNGSKVLDSSIENIYGGADTEIAIFGVKNENIIHPVSTPITINFYCFGTGPEEPSSDNTSVIEDNFLPTEMQAFLNQLDQDLNRKNHSVNSCNPLITSDLDPEVSKWANERVPRAGGEVSDSIVLAVDAWMKTIKSKGLRSKIKRCNLFAGSNLSAALVPVVCDSGYPVDVNMGNLHFDESSYNIKSGLKVTDHSSLGTTIGLNTPATQYLDTGVKGNGLLLSRDGHVAFAAGSNSLENQAVQIPIGLSCSQLGTDGKGPIEVESYYDGSKQYFNFKWFDKTSANWRQTTKWVGNEMVLINADNSNGGSVGLYKGGSPIYQTGAGGYGTDELEENQTFTLFSQTAVSRSATHETVGGLIIPGRSSLIPIEIGGQSYIYALTEEEYTLENLINPSHSGGDRSKNVEKYIQDKYGHRWESVTHNDIKLLWSQGSTTNDFVFKRLLQDLKHEYKYDKPIGWLDIENSSTEASDIFGQETRLLLQNNNQSVLTQAYNTYNSYNSDDSTKTIVRNISNNTYDKPCDSCGLSKTKAPLLIKAKVSDASFSSADIKQTYVGSASFYSIGLQLSAADIQEINAAYQTFATAMERPM